MVEQSGGQRPVAVFVAAHHLLSYYPPLLDSSVHAPGPAPSQTSDDSCQGQTLTEAGKARITPLAVLIELGLLDRVCAPVAPVHQSIESTSGDPQQGARVSGRGTYWKETIL